MIKINTKFCRKMLFLGLLSCAMNSAVGTTIEFNYSGSGPFTSIGSGSFSYADGLSQIGLADLNLFSLNLIADYGDSVKPSFYFKLSDLTTFNAVVDQNLQLSNLSLATNTVFSNPLTNSAGAVFAPIGFNITSLATPGGASTFNSFSTITTGIAVQSTAQSVDEPNVFAYFSLASLLYFAISTRRSRLAVPHLFLK